MNWDVNNCCSASTSTPKRRRLETRKLSCSNFISKRSQSIANTAKAASLITADRCESPPIPCNQVEFLCNSGSNTSICSDIPCSPGALDSCLRDISNLESFIVNKENSQSIKNVNIMESIDEINEDYDELFISKLEQDINLNQGLLTCEREPLHGIEDSFNLVNETIINKNNDLCSLFETKDSFLLDIRESGIVLESTTKVNEVKPSNNVNNLFYGLPLIVKGLFKTYRNIEKLYDWQEECLSLNSVKERKNLIYALPTSGGKTLVAEILMLREILNRKHNVLFILPFVAIVQEKIWALAPFALQLDFLVEEYASGKGHIPPKKRRKKNSIYIATIEKGLALVRSLVEEKRLQELGLIVVDELHLIGEAGRGGNLEMLLTTVIFANKGIQIVGMSATIGNLPDLAKFLKADVFERKFRPVELTEFVKRGDMLYRIVYEAESLEFVPERQLRYDYTSAGSAADPDWLGGLVSEVVPQGSCLIFCPTKRNCENVAALLCKLQRREMVSHRTEERCALQEALRAEGASPELVRAARLGLAYHHAGLAADERALLEQAFRSGVISVLCCTSTLAAGVNLPARRVIVRAPRVGREPMPLAAYKQMVGRAGRAGVCDTGESIIICGEHEWAGLRNTLSGGVAAVRSVLARACAELLLSAVALRLASTRPAFRDLLACTLLAVECEGINQICDESIRSLLQSGAIEVEGGGPVKEGGPVEGECYIHNDTQFVISKLGDAAIKGCMELPAARQLLSDVRVARRGLVLVGALHLLYLVTPHAPAHRPDYTHYYSLYCSLDEEGVLTARALGITEMNAVRMMTGKPITNVPESVLRRFYLALVLRDMWREIPCAVVADKYLMSRGAVQALMAGASAQAAGAERACGALGVWALRPLLAEVAERLRLCAAPELRALMQLPAVKKARAVQLVRGGFGSVEAVARARPQQLAGAVPHLSLRAAGHLVSAARMMLIEKVENLRAEAEDVMDELKL